MLILAAALSLVSGNLRVSPPVPRDASKFGVVEFAVSTGETYTNPFDSNEVDVEGTFSLQDGTRIVLPAFWNGNGFALRFCPTKAGNWHLSVSDDTPGHRMASVATSFRVSNSHEDGFLKVSAENRRYFALNSGRSFVPIGLNLCWPDKTGLNSYETRFAKLHSVGGNFARIWTTQERRLETKEAGLGKYDLGSAAYYDGVFRLALKHGIRTMLTFDDYRVLAKTDYFNAHWDSSPYNAVNGGPLNEPTDFFKDPTCQRLYKQRLRYLVARYSAYPSLSIWEIYNEQDNIPKPGVPTSWFREMTQYLASIDPYRHPITTSYSWDDKAEVWNSPAVGLTQRHLYGQGDTVDFVSMIEGNSRKLTAYDKPRLIGEFGITWKEPDIKLDKARMGTPLHDALWSSIMTGDAGGAMTWWWDNYLEPLNLWPVFTGISKFVAPIDFAHRDFQPLSLHVDGMTALGMQDAASGETIAWLHDPASTWKNDAEGVEPKEWSNAVLEIPTMHAASVEIWDTRSGEVVRRSRETPLRGAIVVALPPFRRDIAVHVFCKRG